MPRSKKTQGAKAPGLEAGASYGEKSENLQAQNPNEGGIALPNMETKYDTTRTPDGQVASARPQGVVDAPLDLAQQWIPNVTPLTAADDRPDLGLTAGIQPQPMPGAQLGTYSSERSNRLIKRLAMTTGNPNLTALVESFESRG